MRDICSVFALFAALDELVASHALVVVIYVDVVVALAGLLPWHLPPTCLLIADAALSFRVHGRHLNITDIALVLFVALSAML